MKTSLALSPSPPPKQPGCESPKRTVQDSNSPKVSRTKIVPTQSVPRGQDCTCICCAVRCSARLLSLASRASSAWARSCVVPFPP
eukprot:3006428-Rhodomonas_salina.1